MLVESQIEYISRVQDQSLIIQDRIKNDIEEASQHHMITKIDSDLRSTLKQQEYLCRLCENIEVSILFNYDYPKSNPKYFVQQQYEESPLIDKETWQIKITNQATVLKTLDAIIIQFTQNPLQSDKWIQQQIQKSIQQFPIPLDTLNNYNEANQQDPYQKLQEQAINNQNIKQKVLKNYQEIENLQQNLKTIYNQFQYLQRNASTVNIQCNSIINKFSNYELQRVLSDKKDKLDKIKESFYEIPLQNSFEEKEKFYNQFLNMRTEFYKCNSTLTILQQNVNQQQQSQIN